MQIAEINLKYNKHDSFPLCDEIYWLSKYYGTLKQKSAQVPCGKFC